MKKNKTDYIRTTNIYIYVSVILIYMIKCITKMDNDRLCISQLESSRAKYIEKQNSMNISNGTFWCEWINGRNTEENNLCKILGRECYFC